MLFVIGIISVCLLQLHLALIAKLEPFSFAVAKGFKEKYQWWPIMDMFCRYFFVVIVVTEVGKKASTGATILAWVSLEAE